MEAARAGAKDQVKSEFVLMLSVIVANNFRCKTLHAGQHVYFIGFEADAKTAVTVYVFLLEFANRYMKNFNFLSGRGSKKNWEDGFVLGLNQAFSERAGFELMVTTPIKVLEVYEGLNRKKTYEADDVKANTKITEAFLDGLRRGKESLDHREIQTYA